MKNQLVNRPLSAISLTKRLYKRVNKVFSFHVNAIVSRIQHASRHEKLPKESCLTIMVVFGCHRDAPDWGNHQRGD